MSRRPLFLERSSYRRRRLGDAARILPVLGLILLLLPVWWAPDQVSLTGGALWLFGLWAGLIVLIGALHWALARAEQAARLAQIRERRDLDLDDATQTGTDHPAPPTTIPDDEARDAR